MCIDVTVAPVTAPITAPMTAVGIGITRLIIATITPVMIPAPVPVRRMLTMRFRSIYGSYGSANAISLLVVPAPVAMITYCFPARLRNVIGFE